MRVRAGSLLVLLAACGARDESVRVGVAPSLIFPRGLLDSVTKVTLTVYDVAADLACDTATGKLTGTIPDPLLTKELGTQCGAGIKFCGDLVIPKSDNDRIFAATGASTTDASFA